MFFDMNDELSFRMVPSLKLRDKNLIKHLKHLGLEDE